MGHMFLKDKFRGMLELLLVIKYMYIDFSFPTRFGRTRTIARQMAIDKESYLYADTHHNAGVLLGGYHWPQ